MFILGHMGIGSKLVSPFSEGLPKKWLLIGTLLPDLIDKPLYYGLSWIMGAQGADLGLISGTRTFGHTALLLFSLSIASMAKQSRALGALALGMATHLLLDSLTEYFRPAALPAQDATAGVIHAILFPFLGARFPVMPVSTLGEHLETLKIPVIVGAEIVGLGLLGWEWWKSSHRKEIIEAIQERRIRARLRKSQKRNPASNKNA
jgi:hypothetical protein